MMKGFEVSVSSLPGDAPAGAEPSRWVRVMLVAVVLTVAAGSAGLLIASGQWSERAERAHIDLPSATRLTA